MLSSIRKFSTSIYAKILLSIVVIPFVFWGMGGAFNAGNKNVIIEINKDKYTTQEFLDFVQSYNAQYNNVKAEDLNELLSLFISNKLMDKEIENYKIVLSDKSLSLLIKNQKVFQRKGKFSRTEYEKFLITNNINAVVFEKNLAKQEKRKQLINYIGGGLMPPNYIVNNTYNNINQKRTVELINLNVSFEDELNFSEDEVKSYYENNIESFKQLFKSIKILEIKPVKLIGVDEYNDLFFNRIDKIDDAIMQGENVENISQNFNLNKPKILMLNKLGVDQNFNKIENLSSKLISKIFLIQEDIPVTLVENENKFYILELIKTESVERSIDNKTVKKEIQIILKKDNLIKILKNIIQRINNESFTKSDFSKLSVKKNTNIKKIIIDGINDKSKLPKTIIKQIYAIPEKKIFIVSDLALNKNFLVYIDKIDNVYIKKESLEYKKYLDFTKNIISNGLLNTYDAYIKKRYNVDINYKTLNYIKNNFNQ